MDENGGLQYRDNPVGGAHYSTTERPPEPPNVESRDGISWSASEFIEHQKTSAWFLGLAAVGLAASGMVYVLTRDIFATGVIVLLTFIFGVVAARKPRIVEYSVDDSGILVDKRLTPYEGFRSFTIIKEGSMESIILLPTKRWSPPLNIYFAPEDGDRIVDTLSAFVPFENHDPGLIDRFLHRIRF